MGNQQLSSDEEKVQRLSWKRVENTISKRRNNFNIIRYSLFLRESAGIKTADEKLLPFAGPLLDHIGGLDGLYTMMNNEQLEL